MLGIGLGGFMEGFNKAQDMKLQRDKASMLAKRNERQDVLDAREDAEYARAEEKRVELENVMTDSRKAFDAKVASGEAKPEDDDAWFSQYTIPKLKQTYLANNDMENADRVQQWADTEDAKAGAKLFKSALVKAQTGDGGGALDDAIKAGQRQGYIAHGYEVKKHDKIITADGNLLGYRIWLTDPDGKEIQQDIQAAELPKTIATFLNPDAAWESQLAASQAKTKRQDELEDYRAKKVIDKEFGLGGDGKLRGDAITSLRKRLDGGLAGDEPRFDDLPADEKERLINDEIRLQSGGAAAAPGISGTPASGSTTPTTPTTAATADTALAASPQRKVLVDTATGQMVASQPAQGPSQPAPEPQIEAAMPTSSAGEARAAETVAPGLPREEVSSARPQPKPVQAPAREVVEDDRPRRSDAQKRADNVARQIEEADASIRDGVPVDRVAQTLLANGIPEDQWPQSVKKASAGRRPVAEAREIPKSRVVQETKGPRRRALVEEERPKSRVVEETKRPRRVVDTRRENLDYQVNAADAAIRDGVKVEQVVQQLLANGVPEKMWPAIVKQAVASKVSGAVVGLGS